MTCKKYFSSNQIKNTRIPNRAKDSGNRQKLWNWFVQRRLTTVKSSSGLGKGIIGFGMTKFLGSGNILFSSTGETCGDFLTNVGCLYLGYFRFNWFLFSFSSLLVSIELTGFKLFEDVSTIVFGFLASAVQKYKIENSY